MASALRAGAFGSALRLLQRILRGHVEPRLAESVAVGRVGAPAAPVVGLGTTNVYQTVDQSSVAIGRLGSGLRLLSLDRQLSHQVVHLLAHRRLDTWF